MDKNDVSKRWEQSLTEYFFSIWTAEILQRKNFEQLLQAIIKASNKKQT